MYNPETAKATKTLEDLAGGKTQGYEQLKRKSQIILAEKKAQTTRLVPCNPLAQVSKWIWKQIAG